MVHVSGITFIRYAQSQTIWKPTTLRVLGGKKIDGPNQDTKNQRRPHMTENKIIKPAVKTLMVLFWMATLIIPSVMFQLIFSYYNLVIYVRDVVMSLRNVILQFQKKKWNFLNMFKIFLLDVRTTTTYVRLNTFIAIVTLTIFIIICHLFVLYIMYIS